MNNLKFRGEIIDLAFIGVGIATSYTLIPLLKSLKEKRTGSPLRILLVEKSNENFTGLAYGERSGSSALLITALKDFLPIGEEREHFKSWLHTNKYQLIDELLSDGGKLSQHWYDTHKLEIERNDWDNIYIPRRFFGRFIKEKLELLIKDSEESGVVQIHYIKDEVLDITQLQDSRYKVCFKHSEETVITKRLVLSVGIPQKKLLWEKDFENNNTVVAISNPYENGLSENLKRIENFALRSDCKLNILIVGSNASAMEMIYKLNDISQIEEKIGVIHVISPQGELPNSAEDENTKNKTFIPANLIGLRTKHNLKAKEIYDASQRDLDLAESKGYSAAITEVPISNAFKSLLGNLSKKELGEFACHYGNEIGKRQRRAGKHYTDVVDKLTSKGQLKNIKGYFKDLVKKEKTDKYLYSYQELQDSEVKTSKSNIDIVFNCTGGKLLNSENLQPILDQLIKSELCLPNNSFRGFKVDSKFQSSPNLYIAGPLLAGNIINNTALWHIEHCGRIISLGKQLAEILREDLLN